MAAKKKHRGKRNTRNEKSSVCLLVEGEVTEVGYFVGLREVRNWSNKIALDVEPFKGAIHQMAKEALDRIKDHRYEYVFVVSDWDDTKTEQFEKAKGYASKRDARQRLKLVITSPQFELWLCAHFVRMIEGCDQKKVLEKEASLHILEASGNAKRKKSRKRVPDSFPFAKVDFARKNVRVVDFNTHTGDGETSVPKLIDFLDALNRGERPI